MKFMSKVNILATFSLLFAISVSAQDLDPTIEVSRAYEGKLIEVHKPSLEMAVPDTMHRFDLDLTILYSIARTRDPMSSARMSCR